MGTDIEKLVDLIIQERMQSQYSKWRKKPARKRKRILFGWKLSMRKQSAHCPRNRKTLCGIIVILSSIPAQRVNVSFTGWD